MAIPMSAAELRTAIEYLGLSQVDLAKILRVDDRTARRWIQGRADGRGNVVPDGVRRELEAIEAEADRAVAELVATGARVIVVYRDDEEMWSAIPESHPYPARWWRHVAKRAADQIGGGAIIVYADASLGR